MKIKTDAGWAQEHRHVMERYIGRPLHTEESVHHINGIRTDNRIENLELWSSSQPSGQRIADKVEWARGILAAYGDLIARMEAQGGNSHQGRAETEALPPTGAISEAEVESG